jgi:anti-sigma regulatory factor (Ser/Thr protein kinase)
VTELVSNSVRHSRSCDEEIELSVAASREGVRVEVADSGSGCSPRPREEGQDEGSGWGLHLVECLSDRWGADRSDRLAIWFELDAEVDASAELVPTAAAAA